MYIHRLCVCHTICLCIGTYKCYSTPDPTHSYSHPLSQERVCEDSASFDLTSTDIGLCISDVDTILRVKKDEQSFSADGIYVTTEYQEMSVKNCFMH